MSQSEPRAPVTPNDSLPPVEPPSARFLVQLFVIPAVIVGMIVLLWWAVTWLASGSNDPAAYVAALDRNNEARWMAAQNLADLLRNPGNAALKRDGGLARRLAEKLHAEIKAGSMDEKPINFRIYLSRALGEFEVPDGIDELIEAAETQRDTKEIIVRRAALEALSLRAAQVSSVRPQVVPVLLKASRDADPLVQSVAAYGLGVAGGDEALNRLAVMLANPYPDTRYNAATGLARHGDERAVPVLIEMLNADQRAGVDIEREERSREYKQALILVNALRAAGQFAKANPTADRTALRAAVEKLKTAKLPQEVLMHAELVSQELAAPPTAGKALPAPAAERTPAAAR